jgi:alpha-L-fucosidase
VFGEVGEKWGEKNETGHKMYTATTDDIRFTRNKANTVLYATALDWPGEKMLIKTFANQKVKGIKSVKLIGVKGRLKWKQTNEGLEIKLPAKPDYRMAYPVRIEFKKEIIALD